MPGNDSFTKLLLHMDTDFTDSSSLATTITNNSATISSAQSVFGGASGLFNGTNSRLDFSDSSDFHFGSNNLTIDFRMYPTNITGNHYIIANYAPGDYSLYFAIDGSGGGQFSINNGITTIEVNLPNGTFSINAWDHIALIRNGNNLYAAVNGTLGTPSDVTGFTIQTLSNQWHIGTLDSSNTNPYAGYLDEFRISNGIARWTTDFIPPTNSYNSSLSDFDCLLMAGN